MKLVYATSIAIAILSLLAVFYIHANTQRIVAYNPIHVAHASSLEQSTSTPKNAPQVARLEEQVEEMKERIEELEEQISNY